jgi:hypothetical protein
MFDHVKAPISSWGETRIPIMASSILKTMYPHRNATGSYGGTYHLGNELTRSAPVEKPFYERRLCQVVSIRPSANIQRL